MLTTGDTSAIQQIYTNVEYNPHLSEADIVEGTTELKEDVLPSSLKARSIYDPATDTAIVFAVVATQF